MKSDSSEDFETFDSSKTSNRSTKKFNVIKNKGKKNDKSDFITIFSDLFNNINYKVAILLFILGIFIFSDSFIETFLTGFKDSVEGDSPTTKGTMLQLIFLTLGYVMLDLMVSGKII
jgi:hypothetical protein